MWVPGNIIAELTDTKGNYSLLGDLQQTQRVSTSHSCANLTYTVFSNHETLLVSLRSPIPTTTMTSNFKHPILHITLQKCPPGFSLLKSSGRYMCGCAPVLKTYGTTCNITSKDIYRKPPVWIGYYNAAGQKKSGLDATNISSCYWQWTWESLEKPFPWRHWPSMTVTGQVSIPTLGQLKCRHVPRCKG